MATLAPEALNHTEKVKYVSETHLKLELVIDEALMKKIERLKDFTAHKNSTTRDLIESLVDEALRKKDPALKVKRASPEKLKNGELVTGNLKVEEPPGNSCYISKELKRQVWIKAQSQCTFVSPSGRRCEARRFLQIEHIKPFALGGKSEPENLALLCSSHNKLRAIHSFGRSTMDRYLAP